MKIYMVKKLRFCILLILLGVFCLQSIANIHFTESFTSPNFSTASFYTGSFILSSGTWDAKNVMGLETINAYNGTGEATKFSRYLEAYLITPAVNSVGTVSFYYRNFSDIIGGGSFKLQKSVNNGVFTDISTVTFTNATTYTLFSASINDPSSNIRFRIFCPVNNQGFLCIDEVVVTDIGQTLAANPSTLTEINYYEGLGPSVSKSFNLFGSNLTGVPGNISIVAPVDYEISADNITFLPNLSVAYTSSTLAATPIYVRLKSGLAVNNYNSETISVSGGGVASFNVTCSGNVTVKPLPSININPTTLSGYSYVFGSGPSVAQSYSISVTNLTSYPGNIAIVAPSSFELSLDYAMYSDSLHIPYTTGTVASTMVYVRQKSGLPVNSYSESITNEVEGVIASVSCNGSVTSPASPTLSVNSSSLSGFSYYFGFGPSVSQSYTINGSNLTGYPSTISITAPTNYEISSDNVTFTSALSVPYSSSTLASSTVYVRLMAGLNVGAYNSQTITIAGGGAASLNVLCFGSVTTPPTPFLSASTTSLSGLTYIVGSGPSTSQSFILSGTDLSGFPGNIAVNAPVNYEISINNAVFSASATIAYTSSTLASTLIYVRLKSGLPIGIYNSEIIALSGGGATTIDVTCSGSVTAVPPATLAVSSSTMSGFTYVTGLGPSTSQSYNLSGSYLTGAPGNISINAYANYEVSINNSSFTTSVNVAYAAATLVSTPIYVRLKAGLAIGTYNSELIANAGGGATTVDVACSGSVTAVPPPTLTVNPAALSGFAYVVGSGPSASQSYNLSGANLTGAPGSISVNAPANYEVSTNNTVFVASVNVAYTSATLAATPIYVRLKSGLAVGSFNSELVTNAGAGATTINVTCNGQVTAVSTTCGSESFTNIPVTTGSSYSNRTWTGDDGATWTATTARTDQTITGKAICFKGYMQSPVATGGVGNITVTTKFPFSDGTFDLPVFVNGTQVGTVPVATTATTTTLSGINISGNAQIKFTSDGTKRVAIDDLSWSCFSGGATPALNVSPAILTGFTYVSGSGPSASQTYNVSGTNLTGVPGNIAITAPANFEVSLNNSIFSANVNLTYSSATLASAPVYVRLKAGLAVGSYNSELVVNAGGGATAINVTCSGNVTAAALAVLAVSPSTLTGFTYILGSGPSISQTYNLSGTNLTSAPGTITATAPANYEVSTNNTTFAASVNVAYSSATLASTAIYVRLKSGLTVNTYNSQLVTNSGGGAPGVTVACSGSVTGMPAPVIYGVSFANGNYKIGSTIAVTITSNGIGYTAGAITINGRAGSGFTDNGNNSYSITYTVLEGDVDVTSASQIPVSVVLNNTGGSSSPYVGASTGNITVDANRPIITGVSRLTNTRLQVTVNESLNSQTVTQMNNGGFVVTDAVNNSLTYLVSQIQPGLTGNQVQLTISDCSASAAAGLSVRYTSGSNGLVADVAGNLMSSDIASHSIAAWGGVGIADFNENSKTSFILFPNPSTGFITVSVEMNKQEKQVIQVYDAMGKQVLKQVHSFETGKNNLQLNFDALPKGIYKISIRNLDGNLFATKSFIIE